MSEYKRRLELSNNKENAYLIRRPVKKNKPNESNSSNIQKTLIYSSDSSGQTTAINDTTTMNAIHFSTADDGSQMTTSTKKGILT